MNCPISFGRRWPPNIPFTTIIISPDFNDSINTIQSTLQQPVRGFIRPELEIIKATIKQPRDSPQTSSTISLSFSTNIIGPYLITFLNGVPDPSDQSTGGFAPWYCSSGAVREFARIFYLKEMNQIEIFVPKIPPPHQCELILNNVIPKIKSPGNFIKSGELGLRIASHRSPSKINCRK